MQTLYLKYRSAKISELDLREVREMLTAALSGRNFPHAWLFSGPRGTGKTSSARLVAKSLNCRQRNGAEPCDKCEMCLSITSGTAVDVVEIDAASNRGIEEIRDLKEKVKLSPMKATYKVYVIDEVHMLTIEAANALLKTLEEPPEKTVFVLCTTEPEKLPATVVSRCTRIMFKKPTADEAMRSLERVVKGEGFRAERAALEMIVKAARGSFRDATKILEQVGVAGKEINVEGVRGVLGEVAELEPEDFVDLILKNKSEEALKFVGELSAMGVGIRGFVERCADYLRERLLSAFEKKDKSAVGELLKLTHDFDRMYEQMKYSAIAQLPLEVLIMERGEMPKSQPAGEKPIKQVISDMPVEKSRTEPEKPGDKLPDGPEKAAEQIQPPAKENGGQFSLNDMENKWGEILKAVKPKNHSVEALLRSTKPLEFDGEKMILEVFYKFHKDKLETERCRQIVEECTGEVFGVPRVKLYLKLGEKQSKKDEGGGVEEMVKAAEAIFK